MNEEQPPLASQEAETQEEIVEMPEAEEQPIEAAPQESATPSEKAPKGLLHSVKRIGAPLPRKMGELRQFIVECQRVLRVTKKPSREEYTTIVKISAIGIGVIGLLGFLVSAIKEFIF